VCFVLTRIQTAQGREDEIAWLWDVRMKSIHTILIVRN
jgi:hypothetical protein